MEWRNERNQTKRRKPTNHRPDCGLGVPVVVSTMNRAKIKQIAYWIASFVLLMVFIGLETWEVL